MLVLHRNNVSILIVFIASTVKVSLLNVFVNKYKSNNSHPQGELIVRPRSIAARVIYNVQFTHDQCCSRHKSVYRADLGIVPLSI